MQSYQLWWPLVNKGAAKSSFFMLATQFTFSVESIIDRLKERQVSMFFFKKKQERKKARDWLCLWWALLDWFAPDRIYSLVFYILPAVIITKKIVRLSSLILTETLTFIFTTRGEGDLLFTSIPPTSEFLLCLASPPLRDVWTDKHLLSTFVFGKWELQLYALIAPKSHAFERVWIKSTLALKHFFFN